MVKEGFIANESEMHLKCLRCGARHRLQFETKVNIELDGHTETERNCSAKKRRAEAEHSSVV